MDPSASLDRWGGWLGTSVALASLGLVALADLGLFTPLLGVATILVATVASVAIWRPAVGRPRRPFWPPLSAVAILLVGGALIAPGSENLAGPRDPAVYVATGAQIARFGSLVVSDPSLSLLRETVEPNQRNAWLYTSTLNQTLLRFPAQLFIRDLDHGVVEGGFLPLVPVWIGLLSGLGGVEAGLRASGSFGIMALVFAMLTAAAVGGRAERSGPFWPVAGGLLAVSFPQIWWAREPMAEAALGAWTWMSIWATVRWLHDGEVRWALLAALGGVCGLFTRADGVLLATALFLVLATAGPRAGRPAAAGLLTVGVLAAAAHYGLVASVYMGTTYGAFTASRAIGGLVALALTALALLVGPRVWRRCRAARPSLDVAYWPVLAGRAAVLGLSTVWMLAAWSGLAPGVGREATLGAASPLAWLHGYVPWPVLALAAVGLLAAVWNGAPRLMVPVLLVGGLPALLYLPDPLVTGDHPWMVRRLVPAVIPLLAILASVGARALWRLRPGDGRRRWIPTFTAVALVAAALGMAVAMDRDLVQARHGSGTLDGLELLAAGLPADALVIFPSGSAGIRLALPLSMVLGVDAFALTQPSPTPEILASLARMHGVGRSVYWVQPADQPLELMGLVTRTLIRRVRIAYSTVDGGDRPPPLRQKRVEEVVDLYLLDLEPMSRSIRLRPGGWRVALRTGRE